MKKEPQPPPMHPQPPSLLLFFFGWIWDPVIRRWGIFLFPLAALVLAGLWWGYPKLKEDQFMRMSHRAMEKKEYATAARGAQAVLFRNPNRVEAVKIMVELSRMFPGSPQRKQWCLRLLELEPANRQVLIETISMLLAENHPAEARKLMDGHAQLHSKDVGILVWRATLSMVNKDPVNAAKFLEEAGTLQPGNPEVKLNLAKVHLIAGNPSQIQVSRELLEKWSAKEPLYSDASFALLLYYRDSRDEVQALRIGRRMINDGSIPVQQRIEAFRVLGALRTVPRDTLLKECSSLEQDCLDSPQKAFLFMGSLITLQAWNEVVAFREKLPVTIRDNPLVSISVITAWLKLDRMYEVEALAQRPIWKGAEEIPRFINLRAEELAQKKADYAHFANEVAVNPERLMKLAGFARQWSWSEAEEVFLWKLAKLSPKNEQPLRELNRFYRQKGNALGMLQTARMAYEVDPANYGAANSIAVLSLLLKLDSKRAAEIAEKNYRREPKNPSYTTTYAFALSCSGRAGEGLKILEKLPAPVLAHPEISFYHAVILQADGQKEKARKLSQNLDKSRFLPEEAALMP